MTKKLISLGILSVLFAVRLSAENRLIAQPGSYTDESMSLAVTVTTVSPDQIRFRVSYLGKTPSDGTSHSIGREESTVAPVAIKRDRWAFCFEAPNMLWFYDGTESIKLWTVTPDRGLLRLDSKSGNLAAGPLELRNWIKKNSR